MTDQPQEKALPNPFDVAQNGNTLQNEAPLLEGLVREINHDLDDISREPNFPYFYPVVYHNINLEIPQKRSFIVRINYFCVRSISICLLFSVFASFFSFQISLPCHTLEGFHVGKEIFLSIFVLIFGTSLLYYVQYFPFYMAVRDERPNKTAVPVQMYTLAVLCVLLLGVPGTGTVGIVYAFATFRDGGAVNRFFAVVITAWHTLNLVGEIIVFFMMRPIFRSSNLLLDSNNPNAILN